MMRPVALRRAGSAISHPLEVVDRLLEVQRAGAPGAAGEPRPRARDVVGRPMPPHPVRRVRVTAKDDEAPGRRRRVGPLQRGREVLAFAGADGRDPAVVGKIGRGETHRSSLFLLDWTLGDSRGGRLGAHQLAPCSFAGIDPPKAGKAGEVGIRRIEHVSALHCEHGEMSVGCEIARRADALEFRAQSRKM